MNGKIELTEQQPNTNNLNFPKNFRIIKVSRPTSAAIKFPKIEKLTKIGRNPSAKIPNSNCPATQIYNSFENYSHKSRGIPSNLDKEKLYDENILLKSTINKLKEEVANAKGEIHKKSIELSKKNKVIDSINSEIINIYNSGGGINIDAKFCLKAKETSLITNLKKQVKEFEGELKEKKDEIENLKRNMKITKMLELTEENKVLREEIKKITVLYENSKKRSQEYEENINFKETINRLNVQINLINESYLKLENELKIRNDERNLIEKGRNYLKRSMMENRNNHRPVNRTEVQSMSEKNIEELLNNSKNYNIKDDVQTKLLLIENKLMEANKQIIHYKELNEKNEKKLRDIEVLYKSSNISNFSQVNSDIKVFYNDLSSTENNEINLTNNTRNSSQFKPKVCNSVTRNFDQSKLKSAKTNESNSKLNLKISLEESKTMNLHLYDKDQLREFRYILIKHIQYKKIIKADFEKVFTYYNENDYCSTKLSNNLCNLIKITNEADKIKILYYLNTLLNQLNQNYESLKEKMLLDYSTISYYTDQEEKEYKKGLFNVIKPQFNYLVMSFKEYDPKENGVVKFYQLRRILDLLQGELQDSLIEFLIYFMKSNKYLRKESAMQLDDLNYFVLKKLLESDGTFEELSQKSIEFSPYISKYRRTQDNNSKILETEPEYEESNVIITTYQFQQRIDKVVKEVINICKYKNVSFKEFFKEKIINTVLSDKEYLTLDIEVFQNELLNFQIKLDDIDMFCVYNKYKINDNLIILNVEKIMEDINSMETNNIITEDKSLSNNHDFSMNFNDFEEKRIKTQKKESEEESIPESIIMKKEEIKAYEITLSNENFLNNLDNDKEIIRDDEIKEQLKLEQKKSQDKILRGRPSEERDHVIDVNKQQKDDCDKKFESKLKAPEIEYKEETKTDGQEKDLETIENIEHRAEDKVKDVEVDIELAKQTEKKASNFITSIFHSISKKIDDRDLTKIETWDEIVPGLIYPGEFFKKYPDLNLGNFN